MAIPDVDIASQKPSFTHTHRHLGVSSSSKTNLINQAFWSTSHNPWLRRSTRRVSQQRVSGNIGSRVSQPPWSSAEKETRWHGDFYQITKYIATWFGNRPPTNSRYSLVNEGAFSSSIGSEVGHVRVRLLVQFRPQEWGGFQARTEWKGLPKAGWLWRKPKSRCTTCSKGNCFFRWKAN